MMVQVGDRFSWTGAPALFRPFVAPDAKPLWFALRCTPLREERAVAYLREHGISSFFPVKTRRVTVRGRPLERRVLQIPGYVFAKFPGEPIWHRVFDRENPARVIVDVIRLSDGRPGRLLEADLRSLRELASRDEELEAAARERARIKPGEIVRLPDVIGGDGEAVKGEVVEITAKGGFRVRLTLLGATREVEVVGTVERVLDGTPVLPEIAGKAG